MTELNYEVVAEVTRERYDAVHAKILDGDYASLQADIDDGSVWDSTGGEALALRLLLTGAVVAPSEVTIHPRTNGQVPVVWELDGENGRGSIFGAEAYYGSQAASDW